jgi:hypothetical protein
VDRVPAGHDRCEFEVHEPPELTAYLRELGAQVTRAAGPA